MTNKPEGDKCNINLPELSVTAFGHSPADKKELGHYKHLSSVEKVLLEAVKVLQASDSERIIIHPELLAQLIVMGYDNLTDHRHESDVNKQHGFSERDEKGPFKVAYASLLQKVPKKIWETDTEPTREELYVHIIDCYDVDVATLNRWAKEVEVTLDIKRKIGRKKSIK